MKYEDRRVTRNRSSRKALHGWLERVEGRFMGVPLDVHPHEALLHCIRITAGEVAYCDAQIAQLHEDELFERPLRQVMVALPSGGRTIVEEHRDIEVMSRWVQWRQTAVSNLAKYSKMALDADIDEREIRLAESQSKLIEDYVRAVLDDVELTPSQQKRIGPAMRRHLELIEGEVVNG